MKSIEFSMEVYGNKNNASASDEYRAYKLIIRRADLPFCTTLECNYLEYEAEIWKVDVFGR